MQQNEEEKALATVTENRKEKAEDDKFNHAMKVFFLVVAAISILAGGIAGTIRQFPNLIPSIKAVFSSGKQAIGEAYQSLPPFVQGFVEIGSFVFILLPVVCFVIYVMFAANND